MAQGVVAVSQAASIAAFEDPCNTASKTQLRHSQQLILTDIYILNLIICFTLSAYQYIKCKCIIDRP